MFSVKTDSYVRTLTTNTTFDKFYFAYTEVYNAENYLCVLDEKRMITSMNLATLKLTAKLSYGKAKYTTVKYNYIILVLTIIIDSSYNTFTGVTLVSYTKSTVGLIGSVANTLTGKSVILFFKNLSVESYLSLTRTKTYSTASNV